MFIQKVCIKIFPNIFFYVHSKGFFNDFFLKCICTKNLKDLKNLRYNKNKYETCLEQHLQYNKNKYETCLEQHLRYNKTKYETCLEQTFNEPGLSKLIFFTLFLLYEFILKLYS